MVKNIFVFFPLFIFLPLSLSALCLSKSLQHRNAKFRHLSEFFLSVAALLGAAWMLPDLGPAFVILSMFPWIWTLRTTGLVCGDISGQKLFSKVHYYALFFGGIVSIVFLAFDFVLAMVTAPFALSVGLIGLSFILQVYTKKKVENFGPLHHFNLGLILLFYLYRLFFPLIVTDDPSSGAVPIIETHFVLIFCVSLYPFYARKVFEGQVKTLETVLETRNKQLLGHSSFSEYRVLSAGLSHEVNNALSIINAKITRLILGRSKDLDQDLRVIQNASNRITRSVRALREFIYPLDTQEVLDLGEIVKGVLLLYEQRLINHGVKISIEGLKGKYIRGQRVQLEQIFLSLINNSVDAINGRPEKWISIIGRVLEVDVEIIYQDSSPAHAEETNAVLSDPLHAHYEFMDNEIRLILAKEITQKHGGQFRCVTGKEFTTFTLTFPLEDNELAIEDTVGEKMQDLGELHG